MLLHLLKLKCNSLRLMLCNNYFDLDFGSLDLGLDLDLDFGSLDLGLDLDFGSLDLDFGSLDLDFGSLDLDLDFHCLMVRDAAGAAYI